MLPLNYLTKTVKVEFFNVYLADINISFITMPKQIQEYHHNVKQFGFWSGLRCRAWSGSKLFAKWIKRWHKQVVLTGAALQ